MTASASFARVPGATRLKSGAVFLCSRAVNAGLILLQLGLVAHWYPASQAGTFFVLWTIVWGASVWARFGYDQLLAKHAARTQLDGEVSHLGAMRWIGTRTIPTLAIAIIPLLLFLLPHASFREVIAAAGLALVGAIGWAAAFLMAGLVRAYDRAGLFGWVQGVVPSSMAAAAVPIAYFIGLRSWLGLAAVSCVGLVVGGIVAFWLVSRVVGARAARIALIGHPATPRDRDVLPTGLVVGLFEVSLVSPVWLASALGVEGNSIGALYAALRIAAAFTWVTAAIVTMAMPLLAAALARGDYRRVSYLVRRSAFLGGIAMTPLVVLGVIFAGTILGVVHVSYRGYAVLLVILLLGRLFDVATGTLGEALVLGDRARWELANQLIGVALFIVTGVALKPVIGVTAFAAAAAVQLVVINSARLVEFWWLYGHSWGRVTIVGTGASSQNGPASKRHVLGGLPRQPLALACGILLLAGAAAVSWMIASGGLPARGGGGLLAAICLLVATILITLVVARVLLPAWRWVLLSPLAIAAATWLAYFVLRPLELYFDHGDTIAPLLQLGYGTHDLIRTVAIAALGCATWCIGYVGGVAAVSRFARRAAPVSPAPSLSARSAAIPILIGGLLAAALFRQQGGVSALVNNPGTLHVPTAGGGYGQLGIWMVAGVSLTAVAAVFQTGGTLAKRLLLVATPIAVVATVSIESRGLIVLFLLAGVFIAARLRRPRARHLIAGIALAGLLAAALEFTAIVRQYAQALPPGQAVGRALQTPLPAFQTVDLNLFDDLVAMQELVPKSIPELGGETLVEIPAALVPRALWAGKPAPIDNQVTAYLYPGATAGAPITMQGELFWNLGLAGVGFGALVLGAAMGYSLRLAFSRRLVVLLMYAVLFGSFYLLLTRSIATMTADTVLALAGVLFAYAALKFDVGTRIWNGVVVGRGRLRQPVARIER